MDGKSVSEAVSWLCRLFDHGRASGPAPRLLLRCALPAALGAAACGGGQPQPAEPTEDRVEAAAEGAADAGTAEAGSVATLPELVLDGVDNDGDGIVDCEDPDCVTMRVCLEVSSKEQVPMYGVPVEPPGRYSPVPCEPLPE